MEHFLKFIFTDKKVQRVVILSNVTSDKFTSCTFLSGKINLRKCSIIDIFYHSIFYSYDASWKVVELYQIRTPGRGSTGLMSNHESTTILQRANLSLCSVLDLFWKKENERIYMYTYIYIIFVMCIFCRTDRT